MNSPTEIKVRGYHLDYFGHVNNARYLEFLEEARWSTFDNHLDIDGLHKQGLAFTVVKVCINYRQPAHLGDVLEIHTGISQFGKRSATLRQAIFFKGTEKLVADAEVTFVIADSAAAKAVPLEGNLRAALESIGYFPAE